MTISNATGQEWHENIQGLPEQIDAIKSLSPLTVVSAGAGTGKTQTLSQRFAWLLSNDPSCRVDQILVLTFTEKAAREMQDRIKRTVTEWYGRSPGELGHLKKSIERMEDAYISTIHAFAMKVIRESGLVLDIEPTASIVPEPKEDLWWEYFSDALSSMSGDRLKRLVDEEWRARIDELFSDNNFSAFISCYGAKTLSDASKNSSEKLGSFGKRPGDLWFQSYDELLENVRKKQSVFAEIWDKWNYVLLPAIREELYENPGKGCFLELKKLDREYSSVREPSGDVMREYAQKLIDVFSSLPGVSKLKNSLEEVLEGPLKEWCAKAKHDMLLAAEPSEAEIKLSSLLNRTCALGWQCWDAIRQRDGILSNNDLIRYAGDVLQKNPGFGSRFKHILIDEFQDTDGLQDKLIKALWKEGENTLFVVGDVKQSIYRFRHANLTIFQEYIDKAVKDNETYRYITLDKSFRTRDALTGRFNRIFEKIWSDGIEPGMNMTYEPLAGADSVNWWKRRNDEAMDPVIEAIISVENREQSVDQNNGSEKWSKTESIADVRIRLFNELAIRFSDIHDSKKKIWDKELKADDKFREVRWSDFAVLVPTRTVYSMIERAFESVGIPYVLCTAKNYFVRGEVSDIINLISLLSYPLDSLYLAGWLSSPFSGVSLKIADECIELAESRRTGRSAIPLFEAVSEICPDVILEIKRLKAIADLRGVSDLILEIIKSQEFLKAYDASQRRRVSANLSRLAELASEYESSQGKSLAGCADYLQLAVGSAAGKEEPDVTDEDQDAVKVLTIHASKGLEYPIAALVGTESAVGTEKGIGSSVKYGVVVKNIPDFLMSGTRERLTSSGARHNSKETLTTSGAWHSEEERLASSAERERLWYVAATRVRDKLFLCGTLSRNNKNEVSQPKDNSFLSKIMKIKEEDETLFGISCITETISLNKAYKKTRRDEGEELPLKTISPAKLARLSASAYAMLEWCPTAYRIAYRQGREMQWAVKGGDMSGSAEFGSLAHWILARWDFNVASIERWLPEKDSPKFADLLREIPPELHDEFRSNQARTDLYGILSKYANSDEGRGLARLASFDNPRKLFRETPFRIQDDGLLLVGATDIFWEEGEYLHIRDWKTTTEEFAPGEYYEGQLMFYGYAVYRYMQRNKKNTAPEIYAGINYLRSDPAGRTISVLGEETLNEIGEKIHKAAEIALSGCFKRSEDRCQRCPWRSCCLR